MPIKVQDVLEKARQLSPVEQLDLIRALSESLQVQYRQVVSQLQTTNQAAIPSSIARSQPITDLDEIAADFWPDDESIDELNAYIQQERASDRLSDQ
jgi:hypothetical protein